MSKGARFSFYGHILGMGLMFWVATAGGWFRMQESVYGSAVTWPAEWWAAGMMCPAAVYLMMLFINGQRWWSVYVRLSIGAFMMVYFSAFVVLGFPTAGIDLLVIGSMALLVKCSVMVYFDGKDLRRQHHGRVV